jgi:polar amino acid transport system permease protein
MTKHLQKLQWLDYLILILVASFITFVWMRIDGTLNYKWNWSIIPNYIVRYDESTGHWVANLLLKGLIASIRVCIFASIFALVFGTILGVGRCANNLTIRMLARTYVEFLRNIPPVVVLFIFYFFLSEQLVAALGIEKWARAIAKQDNAYIWEFFFGDMRRFPSLISGIIVLALFESAFVGEIVRSGIQSIDRGQREAAKTIGLGRLDEMRFIILPQAFKKVLPPLANEFIALIKYSSIISLVSVQELTYSTVELVSSTRAIFEAWITTAIMYFVICFGLSLLFRRLESRGLVPR